MGSARRPRRHRRPSIQLVRSRPRGRAAGRRHRVGGLLLAAAALALGVLGA